MTSVGGRGSNRAKLAGMLLAGVLVAGGCSSATSHAVTPATPTSPRPAPTLASLRAAVTSYAQQIIGGVPANTYWDLTPSCRARWSGARYDTVLGADVRVIEYHEFKEENGSGPAGPPSVRSVSVRNLSSNHSEVEVTVSDFRGKPYLLGPYLPGGSDFDTWQWFEYAWHPACPTTLTAPPAPPDFLPFQGSNAPGILRSPPR